MAQGYIEEEEYWQKHVIESKEPVVVAFWSVTDQDSMDMVSEFECMESEDMACRFIKIDTYKNRLISDRYNIEEIPTVIRLEDGEIVEKVVNPSKEKIKEII